MGSGVITNRVATIEENFISNFNRKSCWEEYLKHVPLVKSLFTRTIYKGIQYFVSIYYKPDRGSVSFCVTDTCREYYMHEFSSLEMGEMRTVVDVNQAIGWNTFFSALVTSFRNVAVTLDFKKVGNEEYSEVKIDMNFSSVGRTFVSVKLEKQPSSYRLKKYFVTPLFEYYSKFNKPWQAQKLQALRNEIRSIKQEMREFVRSPDSDFTMDIGKTSLESMEKDFVLNHDSDDGDDFKRQIGERERPSEKTERIYHYLVNLRKKLGSDGHLTPMENQSLEQVLNVLAKEPKNLASELNGVDLEMMDWIKQDQLKLFPQQANTSMIRVSQFLESSNIKKQKIREDIARMFERVDEWNFDVFTLHRLTKGQTLFVTVYTLFYKYNLLNKFKIHETTLVNWIREVQQSYHPNPYHNAMHAADVTQVLHAIIFKGEMNQYIGDHQILAALIAAVIHDLDHPGLNNQFQVNSMSYLAILYNDRSVLENHHTAQAFELMKSVDILKNVNEYEWPSGGAAAHDKKFDMKKKIREIIIEMVLATDMALHSLIFNEFRMKLEAGFEWTDEESILALQLSIKMADVSNPARPTHLYLQWAQRLVDEMYKQGDKERELRIPISPLMDRFKKTIRKGQIAFMNYVIEPMFEAFTHLLPKMSFCQMYIKKNRQYWATHDEIDLEFIKREAQKDVERERRNTQQSTSGVKKVGDGF